MCGRRGEDISSQAICSVRSVDGLMSDWLLTTELLHCTFLLCVMLTLDANTAEGGGRRKQEVMHLSTLTSPHNTHRTSLHENLTLIEIHSFSIFICPCQALNNFWDHNLKVLVIFSSRLDKSHSTMKIQAGSRKHFLWSSSISGLFCCPGCCNSVHQLYTSPRSVLL